MEKILLLWMKPLVLGIKTENYIAEQIKELKGKLTIIIISHQN